MSLFDAFRYDGKRVLVVGGATGMGAAAAELVQDAGAEAMAHCRAGKGPIILEMKTYRYRGHSMSDPAKYRTKEELAEVREKRDPIENFGRKLLDGGVLTEQDIKAIDSEIKARVVASAEFATQSPEPGLGELYTDIYA